MDYFEQPPRLYAICTETFNGEMYVHPIWHWDGFIECKPFFETAEEAEHTRQRIAKDKEHPFALSDMKIYLFDLKCLDRVRIRTIKRDTL